MQTLNQRYLTLLALLIVSVALKFAVKHGFQNPRHAAFNLRELPEEFGDWRKKSDIELDEKIYKILNPDGFLYRTYGNGVGDVITLLIQYHINDRYGAHDPMICHVSQGWKPVLQGDHEIVRVSHPGISHRINHFVVTKGEERKLIYYWFFDTEGRKTESHVKMMFSNLRPMLLNGFSVSGFIEVSVNDSPEVNESAVAYDFIGELDILFP